MTCMIYCIDHVVRWEPYDRHGRENVRSFSSPLDYLVRLGADTSLIHNDHVLQYQVDHVAGCELYDLLDLDRRGETDRSLLYMTRMATECVACVICTVYAATAGQIRPTFCCLQSCCRSFRADISLMNLVQDKSSMIY